MLNCRIPIAVVMAFSCSGLAAQDTSFALPTDPGQWLNSPPISLEAMKGKAAVLYFFEES